MNHLQKIALDNGTILLVGTESVTCVDPDHSQVYLTSGQQKMIARLAQNLNHPVSMSELYEGYSGNPALVDDKGIPENVAKMKNVLPSCIKKSIKSVRGFGYKLVGTPEKEKSDDKDSGAAISFGSIQNSGNLTNRLPELVGDYCGFYLDPFGKGNILGAYIHIENTGTAENPQMAAYAIMGMRDKELLLGSEIAQVFRNHRPNYHSAYSEFKKGLSVNDKRCIWLEGTLSLDGDLVFIHLASNKSSETWTIILDIAEYLRSDRDRENENDLYRGGLGLALAIKTVHGIICFRLGLVRKSFMNDAMIHNNEELKDRLKLLDDSKDAGWKPLKLSNWLDKLWYDWFMNA